ncbi:MULTISPECIES: diacylglycerol kinase family protein [unclassified Breznakia]|uniref:diacylglycerol/lipid kinase family protein n=1 Tax=unclassified Breznakia TaxID=2623764 RepID=UPI002406ACF7|nr:MULTISPECIES: diacylglycerol kinase family protein [unclassified Breznakia]MDF9837673.1 diacylglycerol kinase (ATP) [Breznakia sp. PFB2-8]MDF9859537.1 diacylglycerol kinase (ATP) [Breznakia sp. PH5-24]
MSNFAYLIYNPVAGKNGLKADLSNIVELFCKHDYELIVYATAKKDDAYKKMKAVGEIYPFIICSGGDGTLNEVVSAYHELQHKPKLAYLPSGTTNDFAKSLKLNTNLIKQTKKILHNPETMQCDIGLFNNHCFMYVAAFGSISEVSYSTSQASKNILGHTAYLIEGLKQFIKLKKYAMKVTYDDGIIEDEFCLGMITNSLSVGGFSFFKEKDISLNDGYLECIFIKNPNNPLDLQQIISALTSKKYEKCNLVYTFKSKNIKIEATKNIKWTLDGEYGGKHKDCSIQNIQKEITFIK